MNDSLLQQIHDANTEALKRLTNARLCWIGWDTVAKLVPGITKNTILRSGPPLPFEELTHTQQEQVFNRETPDKLFVFCNVACVKRLFVNSVFADKAYRLTDCCAEPERNVFCGHY